MYNILKRVFEKHGLEVIDCNKYDSQPNFKKEFEKLTEGRKVSLAFVSRKINLER